MKIPWKKRFLAFFLAFTMMLSGTVFGAGNWYDIPDTDLQYRFETNTVEAGGSITSVITMYVQIDPNVQNPTSTAIPNYSGVNDRPWTDSDLVAIVIHDGVTGIGAHAFSDISTLETVTLSDSVTSIGDHAFSGNSQLTEISDLTNIETFGDGAFSGCSGLTEVSFGPDLTEIGDSAFSGCGLTSVTFNESCPLTEIGNAAFSSNNLGELTLPGSITTIGNNAFSNAGVTSVHLPEALQTIGANAFANNSLSNMTSLTIPDSVTTIGDNAFYRTTDAPNRTLQSLTIGSGVSSIGQNAFSGYMGLHTVTINTTTLTTIGNGAFGTSTHNAYSTTRDIDLDEDGVVDYKDVPTGAEFIVQPGFPENLLQSGVNCYLGDVFPLVYKPEKSYPATCMHEGRSVYDFTYNKTTAEMIRTFPQLDHQYETTGEVEATCTQDGYLIQTCSLNLEEGDCNYESEHNHETPHTRNVYWGSRDFPNDPSYTEDRFIHQGHNYELQTPTNTNISAGDGVTLSYVCQNERHDDTTDTAANPYKITVKADPLQADTEDTIGDLTLPTIAGLDIQWANTVDKGQKLTGNCTLDIVVTPSSVNYTGLTGIAGVSVDLQISVVTSKITLDFSQVTFSNTSIPAADEASGENPSLVSTTVYTPEAILGRVISGPTITYHVDGQWVDTPPSNDEANIGKDYQVKAEYAFQPTLYEASVPSSSDAGYTYTVDNEKGTVTITHAYEIVTPSLENVTARALNGLTYRGQEQNTIELSQVPVGSTVSYTWVNTEDPSDTGSGTVAESTTNTSFTCVPITKAGTYQVTIVVQNERRDPPKKTLSPITVTIAKAELTPPTAVTGLQYTGEEQTGVPLPDGENYTLTGHTATDAGNYQATAAITDKRNYRWPARYDSSDTGSITIDWSIAKRSILPPIWGGKTEFSYTGEPIVDAVTHPTSVHDLFSWNLDENFLLPEDANGTLIGTFKKTNEPIYEVTNFEATNVGTYTITASIYEDQQKNFQWAQHETEPSYTVGTYQITQATLDVSSWVQWNTPVTYDGTAYDDTVGGKNITVTIPEAYQDKLDYTISYYNSNGGSISAPADAGSYQFGVTWTFESEADQAGYNIRGNSRREFTISPIEVTMTGQNEEKSYTGQAISVPEPSIDAGYAPGESEATLHLLYSWTETDDEGESSTKTSSTPPTFTNVGTYEVTVTIQNSNYTAAPVVCTLNITAGDQKITLTTNVQEGEVTDQSPITVILGETTSFTVTAKATLGDPELTHTISDPAANVPVSITSQTNGVATIQVNRAGTATITVTAAETSNTATDSTSYQIEVVKGDAGLTLAAQEIPYTGQTLVYKENASFTAAGQNGLPAVDTASLSYKLYRSKEEATTGSTDGVVEELKDVGVYYLRVDLTGDPNYVDAHAIATVEVTAAGMTVAIPEEITYGWVYDGKAHSLTLEVKDAVSAAPITSPTVTIIKADSSSTSAPSADDEIWSTSQTIASVQNVTDSGRYFYRVEADNYETAIGTFTVTITPASIKIDAGQALTLTKPYDGTTAVTLMEGASPMVSVDTGETISAAVYSAGYADKNAGTGKAISVTYQLTFGESILPSNYTFNNAPIPENRLVEDASSYRGEITQRPITVTGITAVDRLYDGTDIVELSAANVTLDGVLVADQGSVQLSSSGLTGTAAQTAIGEDIAVPIQSSSLSLTGSEAANYKIDAVADATVTISARTVTLDPPANRTASFTGNAVDSAYYTATIHNLVEGESHPSSIQYQFYAAEDTEQTNPLPAAPSAVGRYTVVATIAAAGNYSNALAEYDLVITQAEGRIRVTATPAKRQYDGTTTDAFTLSIEVQNGENWIAYDEQTHGDMTVSYTAQNEAMYSLTSIPEVKDVADSGTYGYQIQFQNFATMTGEVIVSITPATLTVSSTLEKTKVYDGTTDATVTNPVLTLNPAQESADLEISATAAYDTAAVGENKTITTTYTITFGDDEQPRNYTYGGTGTVTAETSPWNIQEKVTDGVITRNSQSIVIAIQPQQVIYDGKPHLPSSGTMAEHEPYWQITSGEALIQSGDDLGIVLAIDGQADGVTDRGSYTITGKAQNANYNVTFTDGENAFTIAARPVEVTIGDTSGIYGETPAFDQVTITLGKEETDAGVISGEEGPLQTAIRATLTTDATSESPVREAGYSITADTKGLTTTEEGAHIYGNYAVTFSKTGTYTVEKRPVTIQLNDQSSYYGRQISSGIAAPQSGSHYTIFYTGDAGKAALVNDDTIGLTLSISASADANAGTYAICGEATNETFLNNYDYQFQGENGGWQGSSTDETSASDAYATYTIEKAHLTVAFTEHDQGNVNLNFQTKTYTNMVTFYNIGDGNDRQQELKPADIAALEVSYEADPEGIVTIGTPDKTTKDASLSIESTGNTRISIHVTDGGTNYTVDSEPSSYFYLNVSDGGSVIVTPILPDLTYRYDSQTGEGKAFPLLDGVTTVPENASVQYTIDPPTAENRTWSQEIPSAGEVGEYTVYYQASAPNYTASTGQVTVSIGKGELTGFTHDTDYLSFQNGQGRYTIKTENPFAPENNYTGQITWISSNQSIATVDKEGVVTPHALGNTVIYALLAGDKNYTASTLFFTLEVTDASIISYQTGNITAVFDGQDHLPEITVAEPATGATILYGSEEGSYPSQTPIGDFTHEGTTEVFFQISAPGYQTTKDSVSVTIEPKDLSDPDITISGIDPDGYSYTGNEITPAVALEYKGMALQETADYTLSYTDHIAAGTAQITITAVDGSDYTGSRTVSFTIHPSDFFSASITPSYGTYGEDTTAQVTVRFGNQTTPLTAGEDYEITVSGGTASISGDSISFTDAGTYQITITGRGNYDGATATLSYAVLPQNNNHWALELGNGAVGYYVLTYGDAIEDEAFQIRVTSDGEPIPEGAYELTYEYYSFLDPQRPSESDTYAPEVLNDAGMYIITARATGNNSNTILTGPIAPTLPDQGDILPVVPTDPSALPEEIPAIPPEADSETTLPADQDSDSSQNPETETSPSETEGDAPMDNGADTPQTGDRDTGSDTESTVPAEQPDTLPSDGVEVTAPSVDDTADKTEETFDGISIPEISTLLAANNYEGQGTFVILIQQRNLSDPGVSVEVDSPVSYDPSGATPDFTAAYLAPSTGSNLLLESDYTASYANHTAVGKGLLMLTATTDSKNFTGFRQVPFDIQAASLEETLPDGTARFTVDAIADQNYSGSPITPVVTVRDHLTGTVLSSTNYTVSYDNNIYPTDRAQAKITGQGNYEGEILAQFHILAGETSRDLVLTVGRTEWTYDGHTNAESISVAYDGQPLTIGRDYTLTIVRDDQPEQSFQTEADAIAFLDQPGNYTITATGAGGYDPNMKDQKTVTIHKAQPTLTIQANPTSFYGSQTVTLTVTASNLPAGTSFTELPYTKDGEVQTALPLTEHSDGTWTAVFSAPSEKATYQFTLTYAGNDYYESAVASSTVTALGSNTGGGGGGGGGGTTSYLINATATGNGSVEPEGQITISFGNDVTIQFIPNEGAQVLEVLVDGETVAVTSNSYTFENVHENHRIEVHFSQAEPAIPVGPNMPVQSTGVEDQLDTVNHYAYLFGYPDGTFRPDAPMTRAEAAQMFYGLLINKNAPAIPSFTDVEPGSWYETAVNTLSGLGIVSGMGDGTFQPDRYITRAEFTSMALRFADLPAGVEETIFSDVHEGDWFYSTVAGAVHYGWVTGYPDGTFRPERIITRAEVATIVNGMLNRAPDIEAIHRNIEQLRGFTDLTQTHWAYYFLMEATNTHGYTRINGIETWHDPDR